MATYSRYRRAWRSGNYRTRGSFGRRWYGGKNKKYWGQFKAANQQRDQATMVLNSQVPLNIAIPVDDTSNFGVFNLWNVLRTSSFFDNYAGMYDQVKMDSVRIRLTGSWQEQSEADHSKRIIPTITTAFDRNGFLDGNLPEEAAVLAYSSALAKPWSLGSAFSQTRSLYTSTMQEKSQYIPTSSLKDPSVAANATCANPCWNGSCISCPFKPIYIVHGSLPTAASTSATTLHFTVEFDICVTFRGLRKRASPYDGMDIYSLYSITYNLDEQDVDDAYVVPEGTVEFTEPGMVVSYFQSVNGISFAAQYIASAGNYNIHGWSTFRPKGYVFFPSASANKDVTLTFREVGGTDTIRYTMYGAYFPEGEWYTQSLPGPVFTMDPAWYTADTATRNEDMRD